GGGGGGRKGRKAGAGAGRPPGVQKQPLSPVSEVDAGGQGAADRQPATRPSTAARKNDLVSNRRSLAAAGPLKIVVVPPATPPGGIAGSVCTRTRIGGCRVAVERAADRYTPHL